MGERQRRIHLLVEGQTEETVVRDVLAPYLSARGFWISSSVLVTKRPAGRSWNHGGVTSWRQMRGDICRLLGDSSLGIVTTLIDYYGLPQDVPGMTSRPAGSAVDRVTHVEEAMRVAVGDQRFLPHLVLHELEAWVYAARTQLADLRGEPGLSATLDAESAAAGGPESVNDGVTTSPSKRLERHCPGYAKTFDGPLAIADLGVPALREACPHADGWFDALGA